MRQRALEEGPRCLRARIHDFPGCHLAIEVGDFLLVRLPGDDFQLLRAVDRFLPVLLLLVDVAQVLQRVLGMRAARQLREELLRAVKEPRLEIVLGKLEQRVELLFLRQVGALDQVLVHADRALDFAAPAKQRTQREMQLDRLRLHFHDLGERLDRLVGLLVEQEIEPFEIRRGQRARLGQQMLDVDARGKPAEREKKRQREQPPVFDFHVAPAPLGFPGVRATRGRQARERHPRARDRAVRA